MFVLTPQFHPNTGGVQMTTYKLAKRFSVQGHKVAVFSFKAAGHIDQDFAQLYCAPERGGLAIDVNCDALSAALKVFDPAVVINQMPYDHLIGDLLRKFGPPLLLGCLRNSLFAVKNNLDSFATQILPKALVPLFRNRMGRKLLLSMHRKKQQRVLKRILATYDYFVMFAPPNLEELRFFVPDFDERKVKLIPNSIPSVLDVIPVKENRLLWLGRLSYEQKRADLILPLWKRVRASLPDWEFDIVGDGPAFEDLRKEISLGAIEGVTLHGRKEPNEYFRRASIFVMTSAFEGFPNTLIEAQSFGAIPILFNSFPVAEWIVSHEVNGYLVPNMDADEMARIVVRLAKKQSRNELRERALHNARRFKIDTVGDIWQDFFDERLSNEQ